MAGFDNAPEAFLECAAAQVRLGPLWSPRLTLLVLRDEGEEIALNGLWQAVRAHGAAEFTLERPGRPAKTFVTQSRAAFEILTDRRDHGISVVA